MSRSKTAKKLSVLLGASLCLANGANSKWSTPNQFVLRFYPKY